MLNETENLLALVNNDAKVKQIKRAIRLNKFLKIKKILKIIVLIFLGVVLLFFPVQTGTIIGTWINEFFVTIYKNIIK
jgi:hypothetical protein